MLLSWTFMNKVMNHKRPLMNLRKFIVDCKVASKSTCLLWKSQHFFFKKRTYTYLDTPAPPPLLLFVFIHFSMTPPLSPPQGAYFLNDPFLKRLKQMCFYSNRSALLQKVVNLKRKTNQNPLPAKTSN